MKDFEIYSFIYITYCFHHAFSSDALEPGLSNVLKKSASPCFIVAY